MRLLRLLAVGLLLTAGACHTQLPEPARVAPLHAEARRTAGHYRSFSDADALAAYLRAGSDAGILVSAHRGGPAPGYPENALPTFERALRFAPALVEVDVRQSRDGALVLLHDETLERTTTGRGAVRDHALHALRRLRLVDPHGVPTAARIPTLDEALAWAEGRAILTLDVKDEVAPAAVADALRRHDALDRVVVITYTLDRALDYHRRLPEAMLSVTATTPEETTALLDSALPSDRLLAFVGVGAVDTATVRKLNALGVRAMVGTFGAVDERALRIGPRAYHPLLGQGVEALATDVVPLAAEAARAYTPAAP